MNNDNSQYFQLDYLKFLMSILVIIIHVNTIWPVAHPQCEKILSTITEFAVPFFFMTSGYLVQKNFCFNQNYRAEYSRKIFKVYCIWIAIYYIISIPTLYKNGVSLSNTLFLLRNFFCVGMIGFGWQLWYLLGLLYCVGMSHICWKIGLKNWQKIMVGIVLFIVGKGIAWTMGNQGLPAPITFLSKLYSNVFVTTMNGPFLGFIYFVIGETFYNHTDGKKSLFFLSLIFGTLGIYYHVFFMQIIAVVGLFGVAINFNISSKKKVSLFLRAASESIYLIHMIPVLVLTVLCRKLSFVPTFFVAFCVVTGMTLFLAIVYMYIFKKTVFLTMRRKDENC